MMRKKENIRIATTFRAFNREWQGPDSPVYAVMFFDDKHTSAIDNAIGILQDEAKKGNNTARGVIVDMLKASRRLEIVEAHQEKMNHYDSPIHVEARVFGASEITFYVIFGGMSVTKLQLSGVSQVIDWAKAKRARVYISEGFKDCYYYSELKQMLITGPLEQENVIPSPGPNLP